MCQSPASEQLPAANSITPLPRRCRRTLVLLLLLVHSGLLAWSAQRNSWTWDEVACLPAGISHWEFGDFELFDVNPPLVRMAAALPVLFMNPVLDWDGYTTNPAVRPERPIGEQFLKNNGPRSFLLLSTARWFCIPFSLLGGLVCYLWSRRLFGDLSGLLALFLWTFSPTILGHGQLITADVGGTSLGILGFYLFWNWLQAPSWKRTLVLGVTLGVIQLTKSTWIVLYAMWPGIWLIWRIGCRQENPQGSFRQEAVRLSTAILLSIYVLNLGYGFQGTGKPLGEYEFISTAIGGPQVSDHERRGQISMHPDAFQGCVRNQFKGTLAGLLPVPLPQKYVEGIDRQKFHFECDNWSYLMGQWKKGGWWYYYLCAIAVKTPHGTWLVMLVAGLGALFLKELRGHQRHELFLLGSMLTLFVFVSLQTGINRHLRYALPAFPFAFILASRAGRLLTFRRWKAAGVATAGCVGLVISTAATYPHHLSYFNELAGGPKAGSKYLHSSNVDWGQDLIFLKEWLHEHPTVSLSGLAWHCRVVDPSIAGITAPEIPEAPGPGWYALSMNMMTGRDRRYRYFQNLTPVAWAGHSIAIFRISASDMSPKIPAPQLAQAEK